MVVMCIIYYHAAVFPFSIYWWNAIHVDIIGKRIAVEEEIL